MYRGIEPPPFKGQNWKEKILIRVYCIVQCNMHVCFSFANAADFRLPTSDFRLVIKLNISRYFILYLLAGDTCPIMSSRSMGMLRNKWKICISLVNHSTMYRFGLPLEMRCRLRGLGPKEKGPFT